MANRYGYGGDNQVDARHQITKSRVESRINTKINPFIVPEKKNKKKGGKNKNANNFESINSTYWDEVLGLTFGTKSRAGFI